MAQLNVRLDDQTRDSLDALARARGQTPSDLIRGLIDSALGRDDPDRSHGDLTPQSLSAVERRILSLQHEVLARVTADADVADGGWEAEYHRRMVEVLTTGWTTEYSSMFVAMQPEMTRRESSLVYDILDMFTTVERSVEGLTDAERASLGQLAGAALTFDGFDFNDAHEGRLASYAQYLIKTDRYESLASRFDARHDFGNSHSPRLAAYERMLSVWRPLWEKKIATYGRPSNYSFTPQELRHIMDAWPYPKG